MAETKAVEQEQITGARKTVEQIAQDIGADQLEDQDADESSFDFWCILTFKSKNDTEIKIL